jgi:hypothetical protein
MLQLAHVPERLYRGRAVRGFELNIAENEIDAVTECFSQEILVRACQSHAITGKSERGKKDQTRILVRGAGENDRIQRRRTLGEARLEWLAHERPTQKRGVASSARMLPRLRQTECTAGANLPHIINEGSVSQSNGSATGLLPAVACASLRSIGEKTMTS